MWALISRKNTKIALKPFEGEKWFSLNVMQFLRSQNVICCRMYDLHNYCDTLKLYHQVKFLFSFELIIHLKRGLPEISVMKQKCLEMSKFLLRKNQHYLHEFQQQDTKRKCLLWSVFDETIRLGKGLLMLLHKARY